MIWDVVGLVTQSEYQSYQTTIENMGLGLYGGPAYDQGVRGRDGWAGGGSLGNQEAQLYLADTFTAMGLSVTVQGTYKNVVAELPGTRTPENIYVVGAHYDTLVRGDASYPGGDDNASGTAGLLEAARVLSGFDFESTIRLIGFNAEEDWITGSSDYVENVVLASGEQIAGMINLDMILRPGWDGDPTEAEDLDLGTSDSIESLAWADTFIEAADTYVPSLILDPSTPFLYGWNTGDHGPFIDAGFPAIMLIENTLGEIWYDKSNAFYHLPGDVSDGRANDPFGLSGVTYDYGFATDVVRATVATIAQEAVVVPEPATVLLVGLGLLVIATRRSHR
jgi:Zn-dependent M28 family amino/carboxypeptidase